MLAKQGLIHHSGGGWIELICGSMFSGKTEELLRRVRRSEIARRHIQLFKPQIDIRYGRERLASHNGMSRGDVTILEDTGSLLNRVERGTEVVAIDEVQFFDPAVAGICQELADQGKQVIVAGLDQDFRGEPFGPIALLMALAEQVDKLHAICVRCGAPATRTQRLIDGKPARYDEPVILVGGSESYEARCRGCHEVPAKPSTKAMLEELGIG